MKLAENKGTGVAAMRKVMQRAGLTPPLFDSDRARNLFVVTLWLHNLIGQDDTTWLQSFAAQRLSDEQARALVVARRTGSVSNAILRDVSGLDTLAASNQLRQLRDLGLLELRGKGSATHYVLGPLARAQGLGGAGTARTEGAGAPPGSQKTGGLGDQTGGLGYQTGGLSIENRGVE